MISIVTGIFLLWLIRRNHDFADSASCSRGLGPPRGTLFFVSSVRLFWKFKMGIIIAPDCFQCLWCVWLWQPCGNVWIDQHRLCDFASEKWKSPEWGCPHVHICSDVKSLPEQISCWKGATTAPNRNFNGTAHEFIEVNNDHAREQHCQLNAREDRN